MNRLDCIAQRIKAQLRDVDGVAHRIDSAVGKVLPPKTLVLLDTLRALGTIAPATPGVLVFPEVPACHS